MPRVHTNLSFIIFPKWRDLHKVLYAHPGSLAPTWVLMKDWSKVTCVGLFCVLCAYCSMYKNTCSQLRWWDIHVRAASELQSRSSSLVMSHRWTQIMKWKLSFQFILAGDGETFNFRKVIKIWTSSSRGIWSRWLLFYGFGHSTLDIHFTLLMLRLTLSLLRLCNSDVCCLIDRKLVFQCKQLFTLNCVSLLQNMLTSWCYIISFITCSRLCCEHFWSSHVSVEVRKLSFPTVLEVWVWLWSLRCVSVYSFCAR